jgi:hypothetical protein
VIIAVVSAATTRVVTVNDVVVSPAGKMTDAGTAATASLLVRSIRSALSVGAVNVTVPWLDAPAATVAGVNEN